MHGKITDLLTGKGIPGAVVDIWEASSNGKYDFQDPENQTDNNLRGKFKCDENGEYHFYCLKPTAYSLPTDGPAGVLLNLLDRHPMRPAHIHLMVSSFLSHFFDTLPNEISRSPTPNTSQSLHKSTPETTHTLRQIPSSLLSPTFLSTSTRERMTRRLSWISHITLFLHQSRMRASHRQVNRPLAWNQDCKGVMRGYMTKMIEQWVILELLHQSA